MEEKADEKQQDPWEAPIKGIRKEVFLSRQQHGVTHRKWILFSMCEISKKLLEKAIGGKGENITEGQGDCRERCC